LKNLKKREGGKGTPSEEKNRRKRISQQKIDEQPKRKKVLNRKISGEEKQTTKVTGFRGGRSLHASWAGKRFATPCQKKHPDTSKRPKEVGQNRMVGGTAIST